MRHVSFVTFKHVSHRRSNVIQPTTKHQQRRKDIRVFVIITMPLIPSIEPVVEDVHNPFLFWVVFPGEFSAGHRKDFIHVAAVFIIRCVIPNVVLNLSFVHPLYMIWTDMKYFVQTNWISVQLLDKDFMGLHEQWALKTIWSRRISLCFQVTLRKTGQIMVMKETKTFDKEAQKIFVKEVWMPRRRL